MSRRSFYQYGSMLPRNPKGHVDTGLGKTVSSGGNVTLIPPTDIIKTTGEKRTIDGVQIEFLMAPNTEAPAEMLCISAVQASEHSGRCDTYIT